jgi:hypothetical protein
MNNKFILSFCIFLLPLFLNAHTLTLNVFDNEDNTITIEGAFSTGQKTVGALLKLESLVSGKTLYKKRLPDESMVTIPIPNEEYQIVLDGGPGHTIVKKGVPPQNGFSMISANKSDMKISQTQINKKGLGKPLIIMFSITFILIFMTLYFSYKNTNKILREMRK